MRCCDPMAEEVLLYRTSKSCSRRSRSTEWPRARFLWPGTSFPESLLEIGKAPEPLVIPTKLSPFITCAKYDLRVDASTRLSPLLRRPRIPGEKRRCREFAN